MSKIEDLLTCKQALRDALAVGREKLPLWDLNICIGKVDAKC